MITKSKKDERKKHFFFGTTSKKFSCAEKCLRSNSQWLITLLCLLFIIEGEVIAVNGFGVPGPYFADAHLAELQVSSSAASFFLLPPSNTANIYMGFESSAEPMQQMADREPDPTGAGNGCGEGESWNSFYKYNVCVATTCPLSDMALERSSQYARKGSTSLRCYLKPTPLNNWPNGSGGEATHRAELAPHHNSPIPRYPLEGEEMWYGISYFFPNDFVFAPQNIANDIRFIIAQWQHGSPGSPVIALEVMGDKVVLQRQTGQSENSNWVDPVEIGTIKKGKWMDFVIRVKWNKSGGKIQIWVNDLLSYDMQNVQTIYSNLNNGGGFKIGLYYWRWKEQSSVQNSLDAGIAYREIFIDEVREYHGVDGYAAVSPSQGLLPLKLVSFDATLLENKSVRLDWRTASELNNEFFFVERSKDGSTWEEVTKMHGAGTSDVLLDYTTLDVDPYEGHSYYRLRQIDFDGQYSFSDIRSVEIEPTDQLEVNVYPNPVAREVYVEGSSTELESINIYNVLGQNLVSEVSMRRDHSSRVVLDMSSLASGVYTLQTKSMARQIFKQ